MSRTRFLIVLILCGTVAQFLPDAFAVQGASASVQNGGLALFTVDVDGRAVSAACVGEGSPTVLQEIGGPDPEGGVVSIEQAGGMISNWLDTRFCGYDRAGTGASESSASAPRSLDQAGADLLAVLAAPELTCPCVVMGESLGGGIVLAALAQDSTNFAGLVLLDSLTPGIADEVLRLAPAGSPEAGLAPFFAGENEELIDYHMTGEMIPSPAPAIPIEVLTHGAGDPPPCPCSDEFPADELETIWQQKQQELADALGVDLTVAENTGHVIAGENPQLVVEIVQGVMAASMLPDASTPVAATVQLRCNRAVRTCTAI